MQTIFKLLNLRGTKGFFLILSTFQSFFFFLRKHRKCYTKPTCVNKKKFQENLWYPVKQSKIRKYQWIMLYVQTSLSLFLQDINTRLRTWAHTNSHLWDVTSFSCFCNCESYTTKELVLKSCRFPQSQWLSQMLSSLWKPGPLSQLDTLIRRCTVNLTVASCAARDMRRSRENMLAHEGQLP